MENIPGENSDQPTSEVKLHPAKAEHFRTLNEDTFFLQPDIRELFIENVDDGDDIQIGRNELFNNDIYLRCDYSGFDQKLSELKVSKAALNKNFLKYDTFLDQAPGQNEGMRKILFACWVAARMAQGIMGSPNDRMNDRTAHFMDNSIHIGNNLLTPLSQLKGKAACSEFACLAHYILRKFGIHSNVIVGAYSVDEDDKSVAHAYLVLEDGKIVYDPTHTSNQEKCWPLKAYSAEKPLTLENLKALPVKRIDEYETRGGKIRCTGLITKEERYYG